MGALKSALIACVSLTATPVLADPTGPWSPFVIEASLRFGVPMSWITRVIGIESGGRTAQNGHPIRSRAGAMGLMQLMPATWVQMRDAYGLGTDPDEPRDNILAGTAYLRLMYDRFGYPGLFGAYNAGPGRYAGSLISGRALPRETQAYLAKLAWRSADRAMPTNVGRPRPVLFFVLANSNAHVRNQSSSALFVVDRRGSPDRE